MALRDRGSNFAGAKRELVAALDEMDNTQIQKELLKNHCDWTEFFCLIVANASHMDDVWQRVIRTVNQS